MMRSDRFELVEMPNGTWTVTSVEYHATHRAAGQTAVEALMVLADLLARELDDARDRIPYAGED